MNNNSLGEVQGLNQTLTELYEKGFKAGRESVLAELEEEQKKFTQGFAYKAPD